MRTMSCEAHQMERARLEAAVEQCRLELKVTELLRLMEQAGRNIQQVMARNDQLEELLEDVERRNEEDLEDCEAERHRRKNVVKLWKIQLKVMERQRLLERLIRFCQRRLSEWQVIENTRDQRDQNKMKLEKQGQAIQALQHRLSKFEIEHLENNDVEADRETFKKNVQELITVMLEEKGENLKETVERELTLIELLKKVLHQTEQEIQRDQEESLR